jgi:hypothetical protein
VKGTKSLAIFCMAMTIFEPKFVSIMNGAYLWLVFVCHVGGASLVVALLHANALANFQFGNGFLSIHYQK